MGVNGEALQLNADYKIHIFLLQITRETVSGTACHLHCIWMWHKIEGLYNKISITMAPNYTRKKYHLFVAIGIVTRAVHS